MVWGSSSASKTRPFSAPPAVSIISGSSPTTPPCSSPSSNVDGVGLRRAISDEEVERLFGLLGDGKIDNHQNWKGRFKDNSDKMRSGSIYEVADVLKSLTFLAKSKSLSFREKRMLDRAKFLIISEVSEVMRETAAAIEGRVDSALERCFTTKARTAARCQGGRQGCAPGCGRCQPASRRARLVTAPAHLKHLRTSAPVERPRKRAFFVYHRPRVIVVAAIRSAATYVAVSLYVLVDRSGRHAAGDRLRLDGPAVRVRPRRRPTGAGPLRASSIA